MSLSSKPGVYVTKDSSKDWTKQFKGLNRAVLVGIQEKEGVHLTNSKYTVAQVGIINEFGNPSARIPARPFMATTLNTNRKKYGKMLENAAKAHTTLKGGKTGSVEANLRTIGAIAVRDVKTTITTLSEPANAPYTIKKKGADNPLIESGQMRNSITFRIEKLDGGKKR
tara:strand:+ start:1050 stop:1556 length:507 start_codon:yes stop_codon:yes gene_type:complete